MSAINKYDKLGKEEFLKKYRYKESRKYYLSYDGKEYDSKAITGVAFQYEYPSEPFLTYSEFSGGKNTVVKLLTSLGFTIVEKSIADAIIEAFKILKKESSIEEIKQTIIDNNFYNFGAQEKNINDVVRNQMARHCENIERKDSIDSKYFIKTGPNLYKLSQYTVIVENDESEWDDKTGVLYHFPPQYQKFLQPGTTVVYYKSNITNKKYSSKRLSDKAHYFATATVKEVQDDPNSNKNDKYATIGNFEYFTEAIISKTENGFLEAIPETKIKNYWLNGVRPITEQTYNNILSKVKERIQIEEIIAKPILPKETKDFDDFESTIEGKRKQRFTTVYERNNKLREVAIQLHGTTCKVCGFNFEEFYGEHGKDYIQIHHIKPLFENQETKVNPKTDLIPLCANCHAMIHRKKKNTLTTEELKNIIK